tara:strand:- start:304 stop:1224 length:921 start_codon:yes stop_codon:yes gene_type:complete
MPGLSNWREEFNLSEVVTGKMTEKEALKKVSEKSGIKNKVTINPKLDEAVKEIGGEVVSMVEADTNAQKQRLDMKQMILDRQKLKLRRRDMSQAKQEKKQGVEGEATGALKQGNVIAQEGVMKNCGCGQDPCITYGTENEKKRKNALQIQKVIGEEEVDECWKTHKKVGMKMKGGKMVPDCRPKNEGVEIGEGVMKMVKRVMSKKKTEKKPEKAMDAGARARRKLQQKDHETVNFLPMDEQKDAYKYVVSKLKKKYGDGVLTTGEKRKPQSDAEKAKVRAHQAKIDKENAAARAKDPSQGRYSRPY